MTYKEIFNAEKRTKENSHLIHLYYEGVWWRAYEWSAYLLCHYPNNDNNVQKLNPIKKETSLNENGLIFVGLQLKSFEKYLPFINNQKGIEEINDKHIILNVKDLFPIEILNDNDNLLKEWKNQIHKKKKNAKDDVETLNNKDSLINIINEINEWETIHKSMYETYLFFIKLQNKIKNIKNLT